MTMVLKTTAMALFLAAIPLSGMAEVTPVYEYNQTNKFSDDHTNSEMENTEEGKLTCSDYGYFNSKVSNAVCTLKKMPDATECWDCKCDSSYQYVCNTKGVQGAGEYCNAGTGGSNGDRTPKYKSCECADGYISEKMVNTGLDSISYPAAAKEGGAVCYLKTGFQCASGYTKFSKDPGEGITYKTETPYTGSTLECITGYTKSSGYYESRPTGYDCLSMSSKEITGLPNGKTVTLLYFDGNCSNGCFGSSDLVDCVNYNAQSNKKLDGTTVTCHKADGCKEGLGAVGKYLCKSSAPASPFASEVKTAGSQTCYKVTGCKDGYTNIYLNKPTSTDYTTDSGTHYTYTVKKLSASGSAGLATGELICRMASGCRIDQGYYNFASDSSGCWSGCLSWFKK